MTEIETKHDVVFFLTGGGTLGAEEVDLTPEKIDAIFKEHGSIRITAASGQVTTIYKSGISAYVVSPPK